MNIRIGNKLKAFTLVETITVVTIIAILAVITVCSTINSGDLEKKQAKGSSRILYSEIAAAYQNILLNDTVGLNITKLNDVDDFDDSSEKLKELFTKYMDLSDVSCDKFPHIENTTEVYLEKVKNCAYSDRRYNLGFILEDENCSTTYYTKDYFQDDMNTKAIKNACGYIVFATKNSKGVIGEDFFITAMGKRGIK